MTRDEIIRMAKEAGLRREPETGAFYRCDEWQLTRFANLIAAAEREACAQVCDGYDVFGHGTRERFAAAIRARGEK